MKRFHVHVHVEDLGKNIAFYCAMFDQQPAQFYTLENIPVFSEKPAIGDSTCCAAAAASEPARACC